MTRQHTFFFVLLFCLLTSVEARTESTDIVRLMNAGQYQQALSKLKNLPAKDTRNPHYLFNLARALAGSGRQGAAVTQYQALLKAYPNLPEPYNNLAIIYLQQGKMKKAQALLNKAMLTHPGYARVYKNLVMVNAAQAQDAYARALQMPTANRLKGLETVDKLSLPETVAVIQTAPIVTAAIKPYIKPAMVYQAKNNHADKKAEQRPPVSSAEAGAVQTRLQAWAEAWSTKSVDQYLSFYSDDYSPAGISHAAWVVQRKQRINRPKWIRVRLRHFNVMAAGLTRLRVRVEQEYAADNYSDITRKEFILQKISSEWRIVKERGLGHIVR